MILKIKLWFKQLICKHDWEVFHYSRGYYDEEHWFRCRKCEKEIYPNN